MQEKKKENAELSWCYIHIHIWKPINSCTNISPDRLDNFLGNKVNCSSVEPIAYNLEPTISCIYMRVACA